jgi:hypothetical protein
MGDDAVNLGRDLRLEPREQLTYLHGPGRLIEHHVADQRLPQSFELVVGELPGNPIDHALRRRAGEAGVAQALAHEIFGRHRTAAKRGSDKHRREPARQGE